MTWHAVSLDTDEAWSFSWHSNELPNQQYALRVRGMDQAGNMGNPTSITLVVDNGPPSVSIPDRWWIWEFGQLKISPNHFPIDNVKVMISDMQSCWPSVVLKYDGDKAPHTISWDRRFADGTLAPSGDYVVVAVACDIYWQCGRDTGIISIPVVAISTVTVTPYVPATPTHTPQATFTVTQKPDVPTPLLVKPPPEILPNPPQPKRQMTDWQLLGLLGLMLAISSVSIIDPRPATLDRLMQSMDLISEQSMHYSSKHDE